LRRTHRGWRERARWLVPLLAVPIAVNACSRETVVVPRQKAGEIVALFGESWSEPIGELRVTGGRMDGGVVRIQLAGPGRAVEMRLEHARALRPLRPGAVVVGGPDGDVRVVLTCTPACDARTLAPLGALADRILAAGPARLWVPARGFAAGREGAVALVLALALSCCALGLGGAALWRARPFPRRAAADAGLAIAGTLAVTVLLGRPSMANWYSINLPAEGSLFEANDRNGSAGFLLQAAVRASVGWTDHTLFGLNLLLHAVTGAVLCLVFRALAVERRVGLLALALWSVLPASVRVGWSDALHVQMSLLFAVLLLAWLRAQHEARSCERALAPVLAALLPLVRLEALALAPLPLLFGWLVGDRAVRRRLRDAAVYAAAVAFSVWVVVELFVRRYDMPVPDWSERLRAIVDPLAYLPLFRQFTHLESGMPNWFPWPAAALLLAGAARLAARRPALLLALLAAFCLPQLALDRWFNNEGMVGVRYFLPLLALLALAAGAGLDGLGEAARRALAPFAGERAGAGAARVVAALGVAALLSASAPLYRYEYAFQGEYRFLRRALADVPAGARLLHLPAREDDRLRADPDCCLDPPLSPLALAFPSLHFEAIPLRPERARLPAAVDDRTYYYAGALCRLAPTSASERRNPGLSGALREQCAALERDPRLQPAGSAVVPSNGFWPFLEPGGVPVRLYRIGPPLLPEKLP
jgi:hypothetical protein